MLFHAARTRRDAERARLVANALWAEAEGARKELAAAGDQALGSSRSVIATTRAPTREREKAAAR
jgi:hypothetical protein